MPLVHLIISEVVKKEWGALLECVGWPSDMRRLNSMRILVECVGKIKIQFTVGGIHKWIIIIFNRVAVHYNFFDGTTSYSVMLKDSTKCKAA